MRRATELAVLLDGAQLESIGAAAELLEPYLAAVRATGAPNLYPGSPVIAQKFLRACDKAIFCEMLPEAAKGLRRSLGRDYRVKTVEIDGYQGLKAFTPPPERRGMALIDPPYERRDEYERIFDTLGAALDRWAGGIFMIWQPVKEPEVVEVLLPRRRARGAGSLAHRLSGGDAGAQKTSVADRPRHRQPALCAGRRSTKIILPALTRILARGPGAEFSLEHLGGEKVPSS